MVTNVTYGHDVASPSARKLRVWAALLLVLLVWTYARFGDFKPTQQPPRFVVGAFARTMPFIATPGAGLQRINVRTGPGTEFPVQRQFDRGALVGGIARRLDRNGAYWIELEGEGGFVKETVLWPQPVTMS